MVGRGSSFHPWMSRCVRSEELVGRGTWIRIGRSGGIGLARPDRQPRYCHVCLLLVRLLSVVRSNGTVRPVSINHVVDVVVYTVGRDELGLSTQYTTTMYICTYTTTAFILYWSEAATAGWKAIWKILTANRLKLPRSRKAQGLIRNQKAIPRNRERTRWLSLVTRPSATSDGRRGCDVLCDTYLGFRQRDL